MYTFADIFETTLVLGGLLFTLFSFLFSIWLPYQDDATNQPKIVNQIVSFCRWVAYFILLDSLIAVVAFSQLGIKGLSIILALGLLFILSFMTFAIFMMAFRWMKFKKFPKVPRLE
jgi:hypothetical protein